MYVNYTSISLSLKKDNDNNPGFYSITTTTYKKLSIRRQIKPPISHTCKLIRKQDITYLSLYEVQK